MKDAAPFRVVSGGLKLSVRLTPRAATDAIDGLKLGADGAYVQARVRAVPEDGRANLALIELMAKALGVPKSAVAVTAGHTSRLKLLHIDGDPSLLSARAAALLKGTK